MPIGPGLGGGIAMLLGFVLLVAVTFWAATVLAGGLSGSHDKRGLPQRFAGSVILIALGHVIGVVAAHDRAVALFPRRTALLGQLPLLVVMIGYTLGGLTLLFAT